MKKLLLSVIISGTSACLLAQSPTMDFENWTTMNNGTIATPEEPTGWVTGNQLCTFISPGNSTSVTKVSGAEAHGGQYAMKITTVDVVNDPSSGMMPDPTGVAFTGKVQISPLKMINGFAYTSRPTTCEFWYMYSPQPGDSASCGVILTKWNGTTRDTLAVGGMIINAAASVYTLATFAITYDPTFSTLIPDTMFLGMSATCLVTKTCGKVGSLLWVDDIAFSGYNGINEQPSSMGVILYPNPASTQVSIASDAAGAVKAVLYDVTGRVVASSSDFHFAQPMNNKEWTLNTSGLSTGVYSYSLVDAKGVPLRAGKLNVVH